MAFNRCLFTQGEKLQHRQQDELQQQCRLTEEQWTVEPERKQQQDLHLAAGKEWERMEQESFLAERYVAVLS